MVLLCVLSAVLMDCSEITTPTGVNLTARKSLLILLMRKLQLTCYCAENLQLKLLLLFERFLINAHTQISAKNVPLIVLLSADNRVASP